MDSWKLSREQIRIEVDKHYPGVMIEWESAEGIVDAACKHLAEKVLAEIWFMTGNIDYCKRLTEKFKAEGILGKEGE